MWDSLNIAQQSYHIPALRRTCEDAGPKSHGNRYYFQRAQLRSDCFRRSGFILPRTERFYRRRSPEKNPRIGWFTAFDHLTVVRHFRFTGKDQNFSYQRPVFKVHTIKHSSLRLRPLFSRRLEKLSVFEPNMKQNKAFTSQTTLQISNAVKFEEYKPPSKLTRQYF